MGMKQNISVTWQGCKSIFRNMKAIKKGQQTNFAILQNAHRLEKGLSIRTPKRMWGYDKAADLVRRIKTESQKELKDEKSIQIGISVLSAFVDAKINSDNPEEKEKLNSLTAKISEAGIDLKTDPMYGGGVLIRKTEITVDEAAASQLFMTRHSVRDFDDTPVDMEKLKKAVSLALRAPSACNRQASQIYVISGEDRIKAGSGNDYHADKYLIITGNMRAFSVGELNDWIVSTSIFCGYLTLALHAEGIGCCVYRKDIIKDSRFNDAIRTLCNIPTDEQIILELAIGNYKEEFKVPVSCRKDADEILHFHN